MFSNGRRNRRVSANMRRCKETKLHVVELTLSDVVGPVTISPQGKFDAYVRQQEGWRRPATGLAEVYLDEVGTIPHYPSDNALNVDGEIYDGHPQSAYISNNRRKSVQNCRYQVAPDGDYSNRSVRPYRPISSHQYLTSTELKDSTINDKNVHLGRPTRTTLLRERQRRRSVDATHHLQQQQKSGQKLDPRTPTRYETVKTILTSMIPPGQSLHSFLSGARYNRSNWIETIGSLDLASDQQPASEGSSVNTSHQRQRLMSEQLDVDYTPNAPPESPVDFNNTDGGAGAFLPALSGSGSTAAATTPSSPLQKQAPTETRSRKIAWEEEVKRLSPIPDRAASTQEKVRFQLEEPATAGIAHHDRSQHTTRPSSVRAPAAQVLKPGRDMAAVVIHGISLHGPSTARDTGVPHVDQPSEGLRRSWSATTYTASGARPPSMEFSRLVVTGMRVSGAMDIGRSGLRLSALKPWRVENDAESTEALVGSRCEGFSGREAVAGCVENDVVVCDNRGRNVDVASGINFNEGGDDKIDSNEDRVDRGINLNEDIDCASNSEEDIGNTIKSDDFEVDSSKDYSHKTSSGIEQKIVINKETVRNGRNNSKADSETIEAGILESDCCEPPPSPIDLGRLSPDRLDTNGSIGSDPGDLDSKTRERGQVKLEKPDQVNFPNGTGKVGRIGTDLGELGQFNTGDEAAGKGQERRIRVASDGRSHASDDEGNSGEEGNFGEEGNTRKEGFSEKEGNSLEEGDSGKGGKENGQGVVFFITEERLDNPENLDTGCHDDDVTKGDDDDMVTKDDDDRVIKSEERRAVEREDDDEYEEEDLNRYD